MTSGLHAFLQSLALGLQAANVFAGIIPVKYQPLVTVLLSAIQAGLGVSNSGSGTPPTPITQITPKN